MFISALSTGIHPTMISEAFQKAAVRCVDLLDSMVKPLELSDRDSLLKSASTSLNSKVTLDSYECFALTGGWRSLFEFLLSWEILHFCVDIVCKLMFDCWFKKVNSHTQLWVWILKGIYRHTDFQGWTSCMNCLSRGWAFKPEFSGCSPKEQLARHFLAVIKK